MELIISCSFVAIVFLAFLYYYLTWDYDYWKKKGIPCIEGTVPVFGNITPLMLLKQNLPSICKQFYESMPQYSMVGFYYYKKPILLIRDPELVKSILVTNFASFSDNEIKLEEEHEPLLSKNPFFTSGEPWKTNRTRLSNAFTSGKLKIFSIIIQEIGCRLTEYTDKQISKNGNVFETELKGFFSRFTGEIVANGGFSIEGHCFEENIRPSTFREMSLLVFGNSILNRLKLLCLLSCPWILGVLGVRFFPRKFELFFEKVVKSMVDTRKREGYVGKDFLQFMIDQESKESNDPVKMNTSITSHMVSFFVDVFETLSVTLGFLFHILACHPDIQEKLRQEMNSVIAKNNGNLTFDILNEMTYMDQVIKESMRMNSVILSTGKCCTQKIQFIGFDGLSCWIEPNTTIYVPIGAFHKDPQYWPEPQKFDPERFNPQNTNDRHKFVFLPFGEGPRMCPGRRMATMAMKIVTSILLTKYSFKISPKMQMPLEYEALSQLSYAKGGLWTIIKPLCDENTK